MLPAVQWELLLELERVVEHDARSTLHISNHGGQQLSWQIRGRGYTNFAESLRVLAWVSALSIAGGSSPEAKPTHGMHKGRYSDPIVMRARTWGVLQQQPSAFPTTLVHSTFSEP